MKRVLVLALLLAASFSVYAQPELVAQANRAYTQGDYATAVRLYSALVEAGIRDGALYFNLGNAYYQLGDLGRSLLNYRRAQAYLPRDMDLQANLRLVRSQRVDIEGDETGFWESLAALTVGVFTLTELGWMALLVWAGWFGLLAVTMLRRDWRELLRAPLLVVGVVVLIGLALFGGRLFIQSNRPAAVVVEDTVAVMSGPGEHYLELYELHAAAELSILERRGDWIRFSLPDGRQGWVLAQMVALVAPPA